jgi:hypothetical protein
MQNIDQIVEAVSALQLSFTFLKSDAEVATPRKLMAKLEQFRDLACDVADACDSKIQGLK